MTKKKKKEKISKRKVRSFLFFVVASTITIFLSYNLLCNINNINDMKDEKVELSDKIVQLQKEKEELEIDILKLKDPEYIAKYVREKYFYSKDGELILRIDE